MAADKHDKSLSSLFSDLTRGTAELFRQELALAKAELSLKISSTESALMSVGAGAIVLLAGFLILLQAVVNGVAMVLPPELAPWLAPLIVGALVLLAGYAILRSGRSHLQARRMMPERTMESLRRDGEMARERFE